MGSHVLIAEGVAARADLLGGVKLHNVAPHALPAGIHRVNVRQDVNPSEAWGTAGWSKRLS
jgi:hypothetical protein